MSAPNITATVTELAWKDSQNRPCRQPYPGLRPFQDHESDLLFGRDAQIKEIIQRLRREQFVAVLGGSGSGKSSLVRAGVVPALRSWAIKEAGDCWLSMICTPGSNAMDFGARPTPQTPIQRFAWKFSKLLPDLQDPQRNDERVEDIATLLRRDAGISRLIERYANDLPRPVGLEPDEVRMLFVIDQFEEIFHPSNKTDTGDLIEDAHFLIERVIDHFYSRHPQCYVVLTMRSEHLNDCAGFLELPDAINASSYLVRRLDDHQLEEAITGPVQSFLAQQPVDRQPERHSAATFDFQPEVVRQILASVKFIASDPDHLPLLQHLLSHAWKSAERRTGTASGIPQRIDMQDLCYAVFARSDLSDDELPHTGNLLRVSLQNHAEAIFKRYYESRQRAEALKSLLRRLAFKDPNTGMYLQQRVNIHSGNCDESWALVRDGFLGDISYLHWDDENGQKITLKVWHEAFIRGWPRFRNLIDKEAERFEEFMQALRACQRWIKAGRPCDKDLMEESQLRRLETAHIEEMLGQPDERDRWLRLLAYVRDGRSLKKAVDDIDRFMRESWDAVHERLRKEQSQRYMANKARRERRRKWLALATLLVLSPMVLYVGLVSRPAAKLISAYLEAVQSMRALNLAYLDVNIQEAINQVDHAANALSKAEDGRTGQSLSYIERNFMGVLRHGPEWLVGTDRIRLESVAELVEPDIGTSFRKIVWGRPWPLSTAGGEAVLKKAAFMKPGDSGDITQCKPSDGKGGPIAGRLIVASRRMSHSRPRAVLVETKKKLSEEYGAYAATLIQKRSGGFDCFVSQAFWKSPPTNQREVYGIAFSPSMDHMFEIPLQASELERVNQSVTTLELLWTQGRTEAKGKGPEYEWRVGRDQGVRSTDNYLRDAMVMAVQGSNAVMLKNFPMDSELELGLVLDIGGRPWLIPPVSPVEVTLKKDAGSLVAESQGTGGQCGRLTEWVRSRYVVEWTRQSTKVNVFPVHGRCLAVVRGRPMLSDSSMPPDRELVDVALYMPPRGEGGTGIDQENQGNKLNMLPIARVSLGEQPLSGPANKDQWQLIDESPHQGWVAMRMDSFKPGAWLAMPLEINALIKMGKDIVYAGVGKPALGSSSPGGKK